RQLPRRHAALPGAAERRDPAGLPVFRLHRDYAWRALQRRGGDTGLAWLLRGRPSAPKLRHAARGVAGGYFPRVSRALLGGQRRSLREAIQLATTASKKLPKRKGNMRPLFDGAEWTFELIRKVHDVMGEIALGELGLDIYPNQIEVITAEQMLDSYSSIGMPLMYRHWSFGKRFAHDEAYYKRGMRSLAYELVINSDPCISYVMEENSMTMQALVIAHAAYGHNHFFKNNYQFQLWTQPDHIIDYLAFAKRYVSECEERHGQDAVENVLDAAHALMNQGVSRDLRPRPRNVDKREKERAARRRAHEEATYDDIYRTLPEITRESSEPAESQN